MEWSEINSDPEFQTLPLGTKRQIARGWFSENVSADAEFKELKKEEKDTVYTNFVSENKLDIPLAIRAADFLTGHFPHGDQWEKMNKPEIDTGIKDKPEMVISQANIFNPSTWFKGTESGGGSMPREESKSLSLNVPESAEIPFLQDPVTAGAFGLAAGARVAKPLVGKALTAGREALGMFTGGASEGPGLALKGGKGLVKAVEAKEVGKRMEALRAAGKDVPITIQGIPVAEDLLQAGTKPVAKVVPGVKTEPVTTEDVLPILTNSNLSGDIIYLSFDKSGKIPTVKELKNQFGDNAEIIKFGQNLVSATQDKVKFRIDVFDEFGRKSSKKARDLYNEKIGLPDSFNKQGAAERNLPLEERYSDVYKYGENKLSGGKGKSEYPGLRQSGLESLAQEQKVAGQSGKITIDLTYYGKGPKTLNPFDNPETEGLFQSAKGIKPEGIIEKIKNISTEVGHKFTRTYEHLANKAENAQLIMDLKTLEKQKDVVADRTTRNIGETLSGMDKHEYDIFNRKVVLDDLYADYGRGLYEGKNLPFKFTPETLTAERGKLDAVISTTPKVSEALEKRQAMWDQVKTEYIDALKPYKPGVEDMFNDNYYRHQVLDYISNNGIFGTGKRLRSPVNRGYTKERTGYEGLYNTDYIETEHQIMAQMFHDAEIAKTLTKIQKGEDIIHEVRKIAKDQGLDDWQKAIPEGYKVWQPKEGQVFYPVLTIEEKTAQKLMSGEIEKFGDVAGQLKEVLAMGGKRKEWVVRNEVAETLDNLVRERAKGRFSSADLGVMTAWKKWQLISPRRYFKYQVRNLTGDAEAAFLGNISGFKKTPQATKELAEVFFGKKEMTPDMAAWFERGGMSSTLQAQEMDGLKKMWMFSRLNEGKGGNIATKVWNKYWKFARLTTDFRESILRYANFLDYKEQLAKGSGTPKNYGASKPEMIDALKDNDDKAFWLSNDLLGSYDRISTAGQVVRERLIPFWSWQEVNAKRYIQLYQNVANDGNLAATIGKNLGAKTAMTALKAGRLAIKTTAFMGMLQVYNHTFFPEEEKMLPADMKSTPHVILGRDDKGNIQYFNRMGTLNDFVSWFGLDYAPRFMGEYLDGKKSLKELFQAQATKTYQAPVNKVIQGAAPFTKLLAETVTRRSTFPDVFKPGTIRDKWQNIARSFGLENEYAAMAGKPSKGYGESLKNLFIYKIDSGEIAFRNVYDLKNTFMKKIGKTSEGFWLTPTGDALYNMKLAIRYEDKEAFSKYFTEYVSLASAQGKGKEQIQQGIKTSLKTMNPLFGMTKNEQAMFINSLDYEEQGSLAQAITFYNKILSGDKGETQ